MENNRRSLVAILGPWVGAGLLLIGIMAGANYLRQAQEELAHAAKVAALLGPAPAEASAESGAASEAAAPEESAAVDGAAAEESQVEASEAVTATEAVTGVEQLGATEEVSATEAATSTVEVGAAETLTATEPVTGSETLTTTGASDSATPETEQPAAEIDASDAVTEAVATVPAAGAGMMGAGGMGRGMGGGNMRAFHMATIPEEYAGQLSPIPAGEESIARGEPIFAQNCAVCHGETGLGDGPAAAGLTPAPPMIAMTSQMLGDDYMLWRISEGGAFEPFNSAMPAWKATLSEDQRWDVINYVRSLGNGPAGGAGGPGSAMGRSAELEAAMRAEMLAAGVDQGVLTQEQADLFDTVHGQIDTLRSAEPDRLFTGTMRDLQAQLLAELVANDAVPQEDADAFNTVLGLLEDSGLMQ